MKTVLRTLVIWTICCSFSIFGSINLEEYQIHIDPGTKSTFVYSNKKAGFWYGNISSQNRIAHQGLTILEQRYLRDYQLSIGDELLPRNLLHQATLHPAMLIRKYSPLTETHYFVDDLDGILIEIETSSQMTVGFAPLLDDMLQDTQWRWLSGGSYAQGKLQGLAADKPGYMGVFAWGDATGSQAHLTDSDGKSADEAAVNSLQKISATGSGRMYFAVIVAEDSARLAKQVDNLKVNTGNYLGKRPGRLTTMLNSHRLQTSNTTLNKAVAWAQIAMDNLVTEQKGAGIWAGLPWFNNYWGRDTFIALPGALLSTGQYQTAAEVLRNFARFQQQDPNSSYYGRVPNRVMLNETIYNTADGTPWFVHACDQYVNYSGNKEFIAEMFPILHRAMAGALKYRVDEYGFLVHEDADTWMDAVGTAGPWSPRGNRAVEIQALWMEQIRISIEWAEYLGDTRQAESWRILHRRVRSNFLRYFWQADSRSLTDHLNPRTIPDRQIRPNAVFALTLPQPAIIDTAKSMEVLQQLVSNLVYPWGVASLAQDDQDFHPYHHYPPYYVPDAAYHNGIVWTWLNGPIISALAPFRPDMAVSLLENTADQILTENAIGSQSELLEAWPRAGQSSPKTSGTVSQAWNLAEFLRNLQEDLVGLRPQMDQQVVNWRPMLEIPALLPISFKCVLGKEYVQGRISKTGNGYLLTISRDPSAISLQLSMTLPVGGSFYRLSSDWPPGKPLTVLIDHNNSTIKLNGQPFTNFKKFSRPELQSLKFATPRTDLEVPSLARPKHYLVSAEEATAKKGRLTPLLFDIADPAGDDSGVERNYTYPVNANFKPGIFDLRRARIWRDDDFFFFEVKYENLVDPGWRPEAGFQLTYTAITMAFEKMKTVRRTRVGMNANHSVPAEYAYNFVILVGNGYRLMDARGRVLAEYLPPAEGGAIGFVDDQVVRFAIPVKLLSPRQLKNAVVLSGGQDDHGGGGVGEFRAVNSERSEWHGGGASSDRDSNVYDQLLIRR